MKRCHPQRIVLTEVCWAQLQLWKGWRLAWLAPPAVASQGPLVHAGFSKDGPWSHGGTPPTLPWKTAISVGSRHSRPKFVKRAPLVSYQGDRCWSSLYHPDGVAPQAWAWQRYRELLARHLWRTIWVAHGTIRVASRNLVELRTILGKSVTFQGFFFIALDHDPLIWSYYHIYWIYW